MGRGRCFSIPKDEISLLEIRSKIERQGVQKTLVEQLLRGFILFKTSKMVTFGHHFKNGGQKTPQKGSKKMSEISLF